VSEPLPPPHPTAPAPVPEIAWRRLDRRMLLVHPVVELVKFLPFLVGIFVLGSGAGQDWWQLAGIAIPVVLGIVRYFTTTYRITSTQVELQRGLIGTKVLTTRLDRVRAVEVTSTLAHRVLGLAKVEIGTAAAGGQDDDKFVLDGLPIPEARQLRAALLHRTGATPAPASAGTQDTPSATALAGPEDVVLLSFDRRWVRYAPLTSSGSVIAAGVLAILGQFGDQFFKVWVDTEQVQDWAEDGALHVVIPVVAGAFVVGFLVLGAIFSVLGYLVTNWDFSLARDTLGRSFHVRRGLFTSTETSLERRRVRGLEVSEPLGLRLAGAAKLTAIATGVSGDESSRTMLAPVAPRAVIDEVGADVIDTPEPLRVVLTQHGPAARRRRWTRALAGAAVLPVLAVVVVVELDAPWWTVLPTLLTFPAGALLAADRYRRLGHALAPEHLVVRQGGVRGRREILQRTGIIGWNIEQSWFQRRAGLVSLVATTAAGRQAYVALDVPESLAVSLADEAVPGLLTPFLR
jgi:putative membrane protein